MEYKIEKEVLQSAIDTYGSKAQHDMLLEEMAELQKEICKNYRNKNNDPQIINEIADVLIMIEQIIIMHDIEEIKIQGIINMKLARLKNRINKEIAKRRETYCDLQRCYGCQFDE